jgi:hypothetical protein
MADRGQKRERDQFYGGRLGPLGGFAHLQTGLRGLRYFQPWPCAPTRMAPWFLRLDLDRGGASIA